MYERLGMLRSLIILSGDRDFDTHVQAVVALRHLALSPRNRIRIVEMGGLEPIIELAKKDLVSMMAHVYFESGMYTCTCKKDMHTRIQNLSICIYVYMATYRELRSQGISTNDIHTMKQLWSHTCTHVYPNTITQ